VADVATRFARGSATVGVGVDGGVNDRAVLSDETAADPRPGVLLDMDLYRPTLSALEFFYPRLSSGAYLFVHDYHNPESDWACRRAVEEFMADKPEGVIEIADMWGSVVFRKARAVDAAGQR